MCTSIEVSNVIAWCVCWSYCISTDFVCFHSIAPWRISSLQIAPFFVLDSDSSDSITNNTHFHPWVVLLEVCTKRDESNGMVKGENGAMRLFSSLSFSIPCLCDLWQSSCLFPI